MKKEEFEHAVSEKLKRIPLETRKQWSELNLLGWWEQAKAEDSYLTCENSKAKVWPLVKISCQELIGKDAIW